MPDERPGTGSNARFNIARTFDAPRDLVWKAWTDPALLASWFGPKGTRTEVLAFDLRPGGVAHSRMDTPDGHRMWAKFVYREIVAPSFLSWVQSFADAEANIAPSPFGGPWPLELLTEVAFEEEGSRTRVDLNWRPINSSDEECQAFIDNIPSMQMGWTGSFDQLEALLAAR